MFFMHLKTKPIIIINSEQIIFNVILSHIFTHVHQLCIQYLWERGVTSFKTTFTNWNKQAPFCWNQNYVEARLSANFIGPFK